MNPLLELLPGDLQKELDDIRRAVRDFGGNCSGAPVGNDADLFGLGQRVLQQLETWLLDEEQKQALYLNPWNIFFLGASAFLCHVGQNGLGGAGGGAADPPGDPSVVDAFYKNAHDLILKYWQKLGISERRRADIIAHICLAPGADATAEAPLAAVDGPVGEQGEVNIALLAAALRLAIALDLRAVPTVHSINAQVPLAERMPPEGLHGAFDVVGIGPHPYLTGAIRVQIRCRHPEIHRALKHHESAVQRLLHALNRQASPRFLYSDVIFEIEPQGYRPIDLKFSVDSSAALQLFTGNRLYSDNRVFLRELIQNAVDACNLRKLREDGYEPDLSITFNDDISIITIRDNGIGMDQQWIAKYFLKVGISLYQSGEVQNARRSAGVGLSFISQFGIGFLSSFLVAEKIVVKTRKAGRAGLMVTITSPQDYFDVRPLADDFPVGTEITLHLKTSKINYSRSLEYAGYLKTNIRFVTVPVRLVDERGHTTTIGQEKLSFENPATADIDFIAPLNFADSEGYVFLRAQRHVDHIFALAGTRGGVSVFQDGIFVTQLDTLLPEGARQNVLGRINLMGREKCALSMDRNRIFWTDAQLGSIKKAIRHGLVEVANHFMAAVQAQQMDENTRRSIINHLAIFFEFNDVDDAMHRRLCSPLRQVVEKKFRNFVRIQFAHTRRAAAIPEADGYSEAWQQRIIASF